MKYRTIGLRAIVVAILVLSLAGAWTHASAQDADQGSSASSASVDVSCWPDADSGGTACAFTPGPAGSVSFLSIPSVLLCAPVLSAGAADSSGDGVSQAIDDGNPSIIVTFSGTVSAGGGGSYLADVDGSSGVAIGGAGIVCGGGDAGAQTGDQEVDDPTAVPTDVSSEPTQAADDSTDPTQVTDESVDPTQATDDATPTTDDAGGNQGDTSGQGDTSNADPTQVPTVEPQSTTDTITVGVYDCAVDPGTADPATVAECQPSAGVDVSGTADAADIGTLTTDATGLLSFTADDGAALVFTENATTIPAGYSELGSGTIDATASDGLVLDFVHIGDGRLQIISGTCPTAGSSRTEFRVIEPQTVSPASTPACAVNPGATFTLSGGGLAGPITATTGADGSWRGFLPAGDYTVTEDSSGASKDVTVVSGDVSVVIAVDYVSAPLAVLNVSRFVCDGQETNGLAIEFSGNKPTYTQDQECTPTDGEVTIDIQSEVSTQSVTSVKLGANGVAEVELPSGSYVLTDESTGKTASFDIEAGRRLYAAIVDKVVGGESVGGNGGGDDTGGSDGSGGSNPPSAGDGSGSDSAGGTGVDAGGTDGGVDAGTAADSGASDGVADVTSLPNTGARTGDGSSDGWLAIMAVLATLGAAGAVGVRQRRRPAA